MAEDDDGLLDIGAKILYSMAGAAGVAITLMMGPVDGARTVYNQVIGEAPYLKRQLLDYCRERTLKELPRLDDQGINQELARRLHAKAYVDGKLEPSQVNIERLWDYTEEHRRSWFDGWIWVPLDD